MTAQPSPDPKASHDVPTTPRLIMARHGETAWSRSGQHTGTTDLPLTPAGEDQARELGRALGGQHFDLVISSPLQRARETARLAGYGAEMQTDPNLVEWDYGAYEGVTSAQIVADLGHDWNLWTDGVPAGDTPGETAEEVQKRALTVIARCDAVLDAGGDVLLVAHGHMLRAIAAAWLGLRPQDGAVFSLSTGTVSELAFEHAHHVIRLWNCPPEALARR
ncbi:MULTISPECIES: histidine phosphatase family protein [unclassified Leifsonia]|uniref:histidine phosphatase family protein n=1 Tax=unclassified Leifsonia TaxID=2663824 RepID=UPI001F360BCC|nr:MULTISPECIES: histidine phosphatase family protein [unclassified Leifsonia]